MSKDNVENAKKWSEKNPQKRKEISDRWDQKTKQRYLTDEEYRNKLLERARVYRENNREKRLNSIAKRHQEIRRIIVDRFGGKCCCCGEGTYEFLAIDHVHGGGNQERKKWNSTALVRKLFKGEARWEDYQLLCHNCNMAKGTYGKCPHETQLGLISDFAKQ